VNSVLVTPLTEADVEGVYAGLRPLLAGESEETSKLSRSHQVGHPVPGLVVVAGGKFTTYRKMAQDAVDEAGRGLDTSVADSCTTDIPLTGADGYHGLWNRRYVIAHQSGLHVARIEHLLNRYGSLIDEILELIEADRSLADPLPGADDYLGAEVVYAATHEGALHVDDVLGRRTRASIETWSRGVQSLETVARLMGGVLGWSKAETQREIDAYEQRVQAERASQEATDDTTAEEARLAAVDLG
jgi:glycerol-3-phosphate dehydrogenase